MPDKTLDCSDLDRFMGKAMSPWSLKDALHNNDFRRWAQAMHYREILAQEPHLQAGAAVGADVAPRCHD